MKQLWLVVYLEYKGCETVRESKRGYFIMRNGIKVSGVPVPTDGEFLKEETICLVCNQLGVEAPPNTQNEIQEILNHLKLEIENKVRRDQ